MAGDAELVALRQNARENMRAFNDEIDHRKRSELLKNWFGKTGQKIYMEPSLSLTTVPISLSARISMRTSIARYWTPARSHLGTT